MPWLVSFVPFLFFCAIYLQENKDCFTLETHTTNFTRSHVPNCPLYTPACCGFAPQWGDPVICGPQKGPQVPVFKLKIESPFPFEHILLHFLKSYNKTIEKQRFWSWCKWPVIRDYGDSLIIKSSDEFPKGSFINGKSNHIFTTKYENNPWDSWQGY